MSRELGDMAAGYRKDAESIRHANGPAQELVLPEPSPALVEVHRILTGSGFAVAPIVYVDEQRGEVTHGLIEIVVRPDYTGGTQMYYSNLKRGLFRNRDPLAQILERGRTERPQKIATPDWLRHVPTKSRFGVSWDEIHNFIAPEVVKTTPHLKKQVTRSGIVLRVPTRVEFRFAGKSHPLSGGADDWEWLYDKMEFYDDHPLGGRHAVGGLEDIDDWRPDGRSDHVGFRFLAVSPPQKLPR